MTAAIHSTYRDNQVLSATPLELITLMLEAASTNVAKACDALSAGDALAHAGFVSKASRIFCELSLALNYHDGEDLSPRLWALYDYIQSILNDRVGCRNRKQLELVLELTHTLADSFRGASASFQTGAERVYGELAYY